MVVDSADLIRRLQSLDTTAGRDVIVSILLSKSPSGSLFTGPAAQGEPVLAAVLATLRPASKGSPQAVRVHVQLGVAPGMVLERSVLCGPELLEGANSIQVPFAVQVDRGELGGAMASGRARPVRPHIRIGKEGEVLEVTLGSGSGIREVDEAITHAVMSQRFRPALLDGRPVEVWSGGSRVELVP